MIIIQHKVNSGIEYKFESHTEYLQFVKKIGMSDYKIIQHPDGIIQKRGPKKKYRPAKRRKIKPQ